MPTTVLLCDTADEVARFQYHLLREHDLEVEVSRPLPRRGGRRPSHPDVIVSELALEGLGGAELVKRFLASSPGSRFVAHDGARPGPRDRGPGRRRRRLRLEGGPGRGLASGDPRRHDRRGDPLGPGGRTAVERARARGRPRARARRGLESLRDDVAKGSTAKADFLSNISHELRTPVTVAKGIAYVLKNPAVPDEERNEFLEQLTGSLDKLMGIVDELIRSPSWSGARSS